MPEVKGHRDKRPTVLVLLGCFGRGIEATGPNQNLLGMVQALGASYRVRVVAETVPGDVAGRWQTVGGVEQVPLPRGPLGASGLRRAIERTPHCLVMTNGFFDRTLTIPLLIMRRFGSIARKPALLGVHGEFSPGALAIRARRKQAYIGLCRRLGLLDGIDLQATSDQEAEDIRRALPFFRGNVVVTPVIRPVPPLPPFVARAPGAPLRIAFLSRIDTKKNLEFAIERLAEAGVAAEFDIYGPITDAGYWQACQRRMASLPASLTARYRGAVGQAQVLATLASYDLFFLPTHGENYGHAIVDALCAGTPALISDQTPWRGLAATGAGWDLPLADPSAYAAAISEAAGRDASREQAARRSARDYAVAALTEGDPVAATAAYLAGHCGVRPGIQP